jgi:hypothetical protein
MPYHEGSEGVDEASSASPAGAGLLQSEAPGQGGTTLGRKDKGQKNVKKPKQDKSKKASK